MDQEIAKSTLISAAETTVSAAERWFTDPLIYSPVYVPLKCLGWLGHSSPELALQEFSTQFGCEGPNFSSLSDLSMSNACVFEHFAHALKSSSV